MNRDLKKAARQDGIHFRFGPGCAQAGYDRDSRPTKPKATVLRFRRLLIHAIPLSASLCKL